MERNANLRFKYPPASRRKKDSANEINHPTILNPPLPSPLPEISIGHFTIPGEDAKSSENIININIRKRSKCLKTASKNLCLVIVGALAFLWVFSIYWSQGPQRKVL